MNNTGQPLRIEIPTCIGPAHNTYDVIVLVTDEYDFHLCRACTEMLVKKMSEKLEENRHD